MNCINEIKPKKRVPKVLANPRLKYLMAFWHRTRREFVPLLAEEWEAREEGLTSQSRHNLCLTGYTVSRPTHQDLRIYELTEKGRKFVELELKRRKMLVKA